MATGLRKVLALIETDVELRRRLLRDPKGTVLYGLPRQMGGDYDGVSVDDELELVALAEAVNEEDALLAAVRRAVTAESGST